MKRSKQLLLVYAELRRALGGTMTAREVLESAERLVDLANYREIIDYRLRAARPRFQRWRLGAALRRLCGRRAGRR